MTRAALTAATELIASDGLDAVTVRRVAARLHVSHTAVFHHFGSRAGLLTAVAAEGFDLLARALADVDGPYLEMGVAYVRFALTYPGHFAAMFDAAALLDDDENLEAARGRAMAELRRGVDTVVAGDRAEMAAATLAGWSMMHGLVHLLASDALAASGLLDLVDGDEADIDRVARRIGAMLHGSPPSA